MVENTGEDKVP
jgi:deoxyhypusine synthase